MCFRSEVEWKYIPGQWDHGKRISSWIFSQAVFRVPGFLWMALKCRSSAFLFSFLVSLHSVESISPPGVYMTLARIRTYQDSRTWIYPSQTMCSSSGRLLSFQEDDSPWFMYRLTMVLTCGDLTNKYRLYNPCYLLSIYSFVSDIR